MKLNLGSGTHHRDGYINVDKYPPADIVLDLECHNADYGRGFNIWPWDTSSVDEVCFHHSLEHMGQTTEAFFHIMKELYRVCKSEAKVYITVPHPRHDDFIHDPTHVRVITPQMMMLFDKAQNEQWAKDGTPNTPLGLQLGVNFVIIRSEAFVEPAYRGYPVDALEKAILNYNNIIKQTSTLLKVVKG